MCSRRARSARPTSPFSSPSGAAWLESRRVTSWLAHYGVIAVFVLMLIDAVFPAASELVMVYGGALASGALDAPVDVFGSARDRARRVSRRRRGGDRRVPDRLDRRLVDRRPGRPAVPRAPRPLVPSHPGAARPGRTVVHRWDDWAVLVGRVTPVARSFISIPAGVFEMPVRAVQRPDARSATRSGASRSRAPAGRSARAGSSFHHDFRWVEYAVVAGIVALAAYLLRRRRR